MQIELFRIKLSWLLSAIIFLTSFSHSAQWHLVSQLADKH